MTDAGNHKGAMAKLPIRTDHGGFLLICQWPEVAQMPTWTLYEGEGGNSVLWAYELDSTEMIQTTLTVTCEPQPDPADLPPPGPVEYIESEKHAYRFGEDKEELGKDEWRPAEPAPPEPQPQPLLDAYGMPVPVDVFGNPIEPQPAAAQPVPQPAPAPAPAPYPAGPTDPYGNPLDPYGNPQQPYGAPQQPYGAPPQPYGAPQQPYGAPQQPYGAPQQPYGAPQQPYGAPQQPYGAPPYGVPQQPYGAPPAPYDPYGQLQQQVPYDPYGQQQQYGAPTAAPPQPGNPWNQAGQQPMPVVADKAAINMLVEYIDKHPKTIISEMLVSDVLPGFCVDAAMKLQEMVCTGKLDDKLALDVLKASAYKGGMLDEAMISEAKEKARAEAGDFETQELLDTAKLTDTSPELIDAARQCVRLIAEGKIEQGKAIIALHYVHRSKAKLKDAFAELSIDVKI